MKTGVYQDTGVVAGKEYGVFSVNNTIVTIPVPLCRQLVLTGFASEGIPADTELTYLLQNDNFSIEDFLERIDFSVKTETSTNLIFKIELANGRSFSITNNGSKERVNVSVNVSQSGFTVTEFELPTIIN